MYNIGLSVDTQLIIITKHGFQAARSIFAQDSAPKPHANTAKNNKNAIQ